MLNICCFPNIDLYFLEIVIYTYIFLDLIYRTLCQHSSSPTDSQQMPRLLDPQDLEDEQPPEICTATNANVGFAELLGDHRRLPWHHGWHHGLRVGLPTILGSHPNVGTVGTVHVVVMQLVTIHNHCL